MKKQIVLTILGGILAWNILMTLDSEGEVAVFSPVRHSDEILIIDAGHGGEDGGAVSLTGKSESNINLAIALKLDQIMGLYGIEPVLLREEDISLHDDSAQTIREKKVSDLHNRVAMVEGVEGATLISIHQNSFQLEKYHGAQVFYANGEVTLPLAQLTQETLAEVLDPENNRVPAEISDSVYLMNNITCPAILVECGFLSNVAEEQLLLTPEYQTKIAAALGASWLQYQASEDTTGVMNNEGENGLLLYGVWQ